MMRLISTLLVLALWASALAACPSPPPPEPQAPDRSLSALDRLIRRGVVPRSVAGFRRCLRRVDAAGVCRPEQQRLPIGEASESQRVIPLRVALDPHYASEWPDWKTRLASTLHCVNRLYEPTGIKWTVSSITPWDPQGLRHQLYPLLAKLQRDYPADGKSLMLGMVLWDEAQVFRRAGGEIGLSQGAACVVPSWPRIENDCVILAHELGHLIGARHITGKHSIMGWSARPFFLPASDPLARVVATYRFHPVNVALVATHRSARFTRHGLRLTGECRRRELMIRECWWGQR